MGNNVGGPLWVDCLLLSRPTSLTLFLIRFRSLTRPGVVRPVSCNLLGLRQTVGLTEQTGGPPAEADCSSLWHFQGILLGARAGGVTTCNQLSLSKAKMLPGSGRVGGCVAGCVWSGVSGRLASCFPLNKSAAAFYGKQAG